MGERVSIWSKTIGIVGVFCSFLLSPIFPKFAVRRLVGALESPVEDASMAAYMALCKIGPRAVETVVLEVKRQGATPGRMQLLGDLGDPSVLPALETFAEADDPEIAAAARESAELLREIPETEGG